MTELFRAHSIHERIVRITDVAGTHFYLVKGDREAALLDTGVGCGRLDTFVRSLTDLPLKVLLTHGHVDHAMGAGHTPGCVTVLMPELRTLLLADACNAFTYLFHPTCSTVAEYQKCSCV